MTLPGGNACRALVFTWGLHRMRLLPAYLGMPVSYAPIRVTKTPASVVACWGDRPTSSRAMAYAKRWDLPSVRLEDAFLRSYRPGHSAPPLGIVTDRLGIYYDARTPSELEVLLNSQGYARPLHPDAAQARRALVHHRLSKYNHAPEIDAAALRPGLRVLVVDQTAGDLSIRGGEASAATFTAMLEAARCDNPDATVYVKTHPEVSAGRKRGHLTHLRDDARTVVLRDPINPISLIEQMDRVYVVTSTMGFEALLAGKPVCCFGMPWYAGWGATDDRIVSHRRLQRRSVDELFAAAYLHYSRYINPVTHATGSIFHVIDWLVRQRDTVDRLHGRQRERRLIFVGLRRWKAANLQPLFSLEPQGVAFAPDTEAAARLKPRPGDCLVHWGADPPGDLDELATRTAAQCVRIEDGFIRSVGLGSDLIAPMSIALDRTGIYFDATRPSDLETLLNKESFGIEDLSEARRVREFIVTHGLTKYNLEPRSPVRWPNPPGRMVVLVPGQVEDDASIRLGCTSVRTNLALLQAVRAARPDAFIVYKPHPDVASGNRKGRVAEADLPALADHVEVRLSVISCIEACDELHTLTSLSGFDALLRGKTVVTYGQPFYAGWGLTQDRCTDGAAFARRTRRLTLDELVAGALLRYPLYWDPTLKGYTSCMAVLRILAPSRDEMETSGRLDRLRSGWLRRQARKGLTLLKAWYR